MGYCRPQRQGRTHSNRTSAGLCQGGDRPLGDPGVRHLWGVVSTTLVQIAQRTIAEGGLAFLVDLPFWVRTGMEILQFVAQAPAFARRGLDAKALLELRGTEPFFFLLNGWNEISEGTAESAVQALRELEQNYPSAGIIVATRTHRLRPPLPGAFRAQLLTLRRSQRDQYLVIALGKSANDLAAKLNNSRTLDGLTRTPLILAEVTELFRIGRMNWVVW